SDETPAVSGPESRCLSFGEVGAAFSGDGLSWSGDTLEEAVRRRPGANTPAPQTSLPPPVVRDDNATACRRRIAVAVSNDRINGVTTSIAVIVALGSQLNGRNPGAVHIRGRIEGKAGCDVHRRAVSVGSIDVAGRCTVAEASGVVQFIAAHRDRLK